MNTKQRPLFLARVNNAFVASRVEVRSEAHLLFPFPLAFFCFLLDMSGHVVREEVKWSVHFDCFKESVRSLTNTISNAKQMDNG